jgi:hypothetical protein
MTMNVLRTSLIGAATVACLAGVASGGPEFTYISANRGVVASNFYPSWVEHEREHSSTADFAPYSASVEVSYWGYGDAHAEQVSSFSSDSMTFSTSLYGGGGVGHSTMGIAESFFDVFFEVTEPVASFHIFGVRGGAPGYDPFPFESRIRLTDTSTNTRPIDYAGGVGEYVFVQASLVPGVRYRLEVGSYCSGITYWTDGWGQVVETSSQGDSLNIQMVIPSGASALAMLGGLAVVGSRRRR